MIDPSSWVTVLTATAAGVQVLTLSLTGWSVANAVGYVGTVNKYGIKNGKRIAAQAILWRAIALAVTVIALLSSSTLLLLNTDLIAASVTVWRAAAMLSASLGLAVMAGADVYERVSLDHLVDRGADDSFNGVR